MEKRQRFEAPLCTIICFLLKENSELCRWYWICDSTTPEPVKRKSRSEEEGAISTPAVQLRVTSQTVLLHSGSKFPNLDEHHLKIKIHISRNL